MKGALSHPMVLLPFIPVLPFSIQVSLQNAFRFWGHLLTQSNLWHFPSHEEIWGSLTKRLVLGIPSHEEIWDLTS